MLHSEVNLDLNPQTSKEQKLLLVSAYAPYGIESPYEEGDGMQMELLNNQITRGQGIHSPRKQGTRSYGLYLIAENITVPSVVLDFPTWGQFKRELSKGYTHVGITFICQNVLKAGRMAKYIRESHPDITIILGGAGASIPELKDLVPYDELCTGEGVEWMRNYFNEDTSAPITGCVFSGEQSYYIYGYRTTFTSTSVFPGLGCPNGCEFCATTHKFGKKYIPLIESGVSLFEKLRDEQRKHGVTDFTVEDENFLIHKKLVIDLLEQMEHSKAAYSYFCFASAETIQYLGIDFMVRLGIDTVWIGIESNVQKFKKLKDIDLQSMVNELRANGIKVLGSAILFQDHHNQTNIHQDIDWAVGLETDMLQVLGLAPCPGTELYNRYVREKRLDPEFPYHKQTGLGPIYFQHPSFDPEETGAIVKSAYEKFINFNGISVLNIAHTSLKGYAKVKDDHSYRVKNKLGWNAVKREYEYQEDYQEDLFMNERLAQLRRSALKYRPIMLALLVFAPNKQVREKSKQTRELYNQIFGKAGFKDRLLSVAVLLLAFKERIVTGFRSLLNLGEKTYQPAMKRTEYNF